jgi:hypothetical protein
MLNKGEYEEVPLSELHSVFDANPIIIDAESTTRIWGYVAWIGIGVVFLGLAVWYILIRLTHLVMLGLVVWGITSLVRSNTGFGSILITGLYAIVPATYGHYLLGQFNVRFFGLYTLLLLSVWAIGLVAVLGERDGGLLRGERSLRGWRALIGVPMLIVFALDLIFSWTNGAVIIGSIALITFIALGVVSRQLGEGPKQIQIPKLSDGNSRRKRPLHIILMLVVIVLMGFCFFLMEGPVIDSFTEWVFPQDDW